MSEDRDILREVWEGRVPVCVYLAEEEVLTTANGIPEPWYLMTPRITYFPLLLEKVQRYFLKFIDPAAAGEMWLESEGQPLKWHIPVGVLFDLFAPKDNLPWKLTAHFRDFPERDLLRCPSRDAVEAHFMSSVKEADALKHKAQVINNMQKRDHKQLWNGLATDKFDQFWLINRKLMERPTTGTGGGGPAVADNFRYIPHRMYRLDGSYAQKLIRPSRPAADGGADVPTTLADLLELHCSTGQPLPAMAAADRPEDEAAAASSGTVAARASSMRPRVLVHGIEVPSETPLVWMSEFLSHPDNFLHIVPT